MMHEYPGNWTTAPLDSLNGQNAIFVTARDDVEKFRSNPRYCIRITVTLPFRPTASGLPDEKLAETLKEITDRLVHVFDKDPIAVLTGIYTGDNERTWVFYATSTHIFQRKFNEALSDLPTFPITISAENDQEWEEYSEMRSCLE